MGSKSLFLTLLLAAGVAYADTGFRDMIQMTETDGSPKCMAGQIKVQPGQLTCSGNTATLEITGGGGGSSSLAVFDEGIKISSPTAILNFVGAGVTTTLTGGATATITIPGGGGSGYAVEPATVTFNLAKGVLASTATISQNLDISTVTSVQTPSANTMRVYGTAVEGIPLLETIDSAGFVGRFQQDNFIIGKNTGGTAINKGDALYISGAVGEQPTFAKARADSVATMPCVGLAAENIAINGFGRVSITGRISSINTNAFNDGDSLYVSATSSGALVNVDPGFPQYSQRVAEVANKGVGNGALIVSPRALRGEVAYSLNPTFTIGPTAAGSAVIQPNSTAQRTFAFPDQSGTVALQENVAASTNTLQSNIDNKITSLSTGTVGFLPYQVSLATGVMGNLAHKVSLSTGVMGDLYHKVSLSTGVIGNLFYQISLSSGVTGVLPAANMVSTAALTSSTQTFTAPQTFVGSITVNNAASLGAAGASVLISSNAYLANSATFYFNAPVEISSFTRVSRIQWADGTVQVSSPQAGGGGGGYATIQDEGSPLTQRTTLNFTGSGVACADNSGSSRTDCTINAGAASAGGSNGNVQYNNSGSLGGASGFNVWPSSVVISNAYETYTSTLNVRSSFTITDVSSISFSGVKVNIGELTVSDSAGTSGHVLTSNGSGAPSWQSITGVVISTGDFVIAGTALSDIPSMAYTLTANTTYTFEYWMLFRTTTTTTGARFAVNGPASPATIAYTVRVPIAADGTGGELQGWGTAYDDSVIGTGVQAINTTYIAQIFGTIVTGGTGGNLNVRVACELTSPTYVTVMKSSIGYIRRL